MADLNVQDVIDSERRHLRLRRQKLGNDNTTPEGENWFGIAMSGGGIRSATINLGFLKTLNRFGILKRADYLSTVSGGGYTHAYVQGTLKQEGDYKCLFTEEQIDSMRQHGEYLTPGRGYWKTFNTLLLAVAFGVSWAMSMTSPAIVGGIVYYLYCIVTGLGIVNPIPAVADMTRGEIVDLGLRLAGGLFVLHFVANLMLTFNLSVSKLFNRIEVVLAMLAVAIYGWVLLGDFKSGPAIAGDTLFDYSINIVLLIIFGFLNNPNALSFHRYYRKQLADLFLGFSGAHRNIPLKDVFNANSEKTTDYLAPYPLINTCLNLQNPDGDAKFKGLKSSDYFLLSPLYCGSKLTGYVPTSQYRDYRSMTLPAAVTVSAAAVNPGLGMYSSKLLSAIMTIGNFRLGVWISNPLILKKSYAIVWWPLYFFKELLGRIGTDNKMLNISDGGHIENLGAYELLRRGCRLIIAVDAGEDKLYSFSDLNNFLIRARNELGYEIRFRRGYQPEDLIRPRPSQVYSQQRYAVADIFQHWKDTKIVNVDTQKEESHIENFARPQRVGTFVYVKSSVTEPAGKPYLDEKADPLRYGTYKYKIYHPDFPHEPTSDQFFDEIQWEAYYQLGQYIGADILGLSAPDEQTGNVTVPQLLEWFENSQPLFAPAVPASRVAAGDGEYESARAQAAAPPAEEVKYRM